MSSIAEEGVVVVDGRTASVARSRDATEVLLGRVPYSSHVAAGSSTPPSSPGLPSAHRQQELTVAGSPSASMRRHRVFACPRHRASFLPGRLLLDDPRSRRPYLGRSPDAIAVIAWWAAYTKAGAAIARVPPAQGRDPEHPGVNDRLACRRWRSPSTSADVSPASSSAAVGRTGSPARRIDRPGMTPDLRIADADDRDTPSGHHRSFRPRTRRPDGRSGSGERRRELARRRLRRGMIRAQRRRLAADDLGRDHQPRLLLELDRPDREGHAIAIQKGWKA